jgi:uncharacterized protein YndB with AHSA1/START domain
MFQPLAPTLPGARRIQHRVTLPAAPQRVFDFVTNAAQWVQWHPATRSVHDVPDRPLTLGETMVEHLQAAHRSFEATWMVKACEPGRLWVIATETRLGASVITYRFEPANGATRFERTCDFRSEGAWRLLDGNVTKWMLARQAAKALENLRNLPW